MNVIDRTTFLKDQLELLKSKQTDNSIEWQDVAEFRASFSGDLEHRDTVRKGAKLINEYLEEGWNIAPPNSPATTLGKARELVGDYLVKRQIQNEKIQVNRFKREMVKTISVAEELAAIQEENGFKVIVPDYSYTPVIDESEYTMVCNISDLHIGYLIENCNGNYFNWDIANERINKYIEECKKFITLYSIKKVYVINTGDSIENTYMRDTQDQCCEFYQSEQINRAIEIIFRLLVALSKDCNVVYGGIAGNHDRTSGDKKKSYEGDNANVIITEQLKKYVKLSETKRISIIDNKYNDKEIKLEINGLLCKFIHGDEIPKIDNNTLANMISCDNEFYDILFCGHWHNFTCRSGNHGRYVVTAGCLSGFNDYSKRFYCSTKASQTICVLGNNKVELIKNVELA